ncbi:peptide ABC transporter substrate-binding protein, partial [Mycobacterium tuberculosis]|nr:peptide ABC transporter substrate-binding protein [Mycobacterium tuberculosis]
YLQWDFAQDFWYTRDFMPQVIACALEEAPFNETHWNVPEFNSLFDRARAIPDAGERRDLEHELQQMLYDDGGSIIWG